jgi:hypothetical protein
MTPFGATLLPVTEHLVDPLELFPQNRQHDHLGKILPEALLRRPGLVQVQYLPLQTGQLLQQRLFQMVPRVDADMFRGLAFVLLQLIFYKKGYRDEI